MIRIDKTELECVISQAYKEGWGDGNLNIRSFDDRSSHQKVIKSAAEDWEDSFSLQELKRLTGEDL